MFYFWKALTGKWGDRWLSNRRHRIFYRLKAAICLFLIREPSHDVWDDPYIYDAMVYVTYTNGGTTPGTDSYPTSYWFEAIVTAPGIFRGWWATIYQDSSD